MFAACGSVATTRTARGSAGSSEPLEVLSSMPSLGSSSDSNVAGQANTSIETGTSVASGTSVAPSTTMSVESTSLTGEISIEQTTVQVASTTGPSRTTSLAPWPDATTSTTNVVATMAPSTTEQPRPSPIEPSSSPAVVITPENHTQTVAISVGDVIALVAPTIAGTDVIDRNYPQDSFGVDADLLRVVAFGGDCPAASICAAWVAVDAGLATIQPPLTTDSTISVAIGVGARAVKRIGSPNDGSSVAVPVGSIVDLHLDEVASRMYRGGEPATPEYWHAPSSTRSGVLVAIGQAAPVRCHNEALGLHDCLSLLAVAPGMTTLTFVSGYTCDFGGCGPNPTWATQKFTLTIAVTPN